MASINPDQHKTPTSDNNNQPLHTSTPSPKNRPISRQISAGGDSNSKTSPISQHNKSFTRPRIGSDNFIERRGPSLRPLKQVSQPEQLTNPDEISSENGSHSASSDDFKKNNRDSPSFLENDQFTPLSTVSPSQRSSPNKTPSPNTANRTRRARTSQSESGTSMTFASGDSFYKNSSFTPVFGASPNRLKLKPPKIGNKRFRHKSDRTDAAHPILRQQNKTIYTAGRPPWYNVEGEFAEAFVIGICGGSASGKTTVAKSIIEKLNIPWVVWLSMDCYYKNLNEEELDLAAKNEWNFDGPESFDLDYCVEQLKQLKQGKAIECPQYDFGTHQRMKNTKCIYGANVIIFEGILVMTDERLRDMMDLKIFVDTDSDIRLARRIKRDLASRGRDLQNVIAQYNKFVKPSFEKYIYPLIKYADIVIPRGGENLVAVNLVTQQVVKQLDKRNKGKGSRPALVKAHVGQPLPSTLALLPQTSQVKGIHTILRDKTTSRDDFIFYSRRLMRKLFELALSLLPHNEIMVDTPQGIPYSGRKFGGTGLCGVSILRAGETMEHALFQVTKDIRLGKILIQTNNDTGEPELHFLRLPSKLQTEHVILMDATVATGAAAMMAIRVLLDHGVQQENIILTSLLMAESGIHSVAYAYPKVKLVTTAVDKLLDDNYHMVPGMGNFGDRYFGTESEAEFE